MDNSPATSSLKTPKLKGKESNINYTTSHTININIKYLHTIKPREHVLLKSLVIGSTEISV